MIRLVFPCMLLVTTSLNGSDWARFRGPNGSGICLDKERTPSEWGDEKNLKWKAELPGPGSSCPIVVGEKVLVTCWSGYAMNPRDVGEQKNLKRHLICFDRESGKQYWSQEVSAYLPEDRYGGMFAENGYASHTPVSDGGKVFAFFGKTGVVAFDLNGKKLWQKSVGTGSGARNWGSASSPILYKDMVIVPATAESESLVALDKETGEQKWKADSGGFSATWGTPLLVKVDDSRTDLVLAVPYEIWGFNPDTGKLRWYCDGIQSDSMCSSLVAHDGVVYAIEAGPRGGGALAVRCGGKGDVTESHVLWTTRDRSRIGTPLYHDGKLYFVSNRVANCIDATTGERVYQSRLDSSVTSDARAYDRPSGRSSGFGRGSGRGRGGQDYASVIAADGKLYFTTRAGEIFVYKMGSKFEQLGSNKFDSDNGDFSSTPAISRGELFIRSSKALYCVGTQSDGSVDKAE